MAQYDSNGDGVLNASDADWSKLRVWVDTNHDGKSEPGELLTMAQAGVTSISLTATASDTMNAGNLVGLTSSYTTTSGTTHAVADVWFANSTAANAAATSTTTSSASTTAATPALHELLTAPATNLLPGHTTDAATTAHIAQAHTGIEQAGLIDHRLLADEEARRHTPLL